MEKNSGLVKHIVGGVVVATVLDLAANNASDRGLLGIALHPSFPQNPGVYLYWSCTATPPPADSPFFPPETECGDVPMLGADTNNITAVPLQGIRIDRFVWNGASLTFDRNLIKLRSFQHDGVPVPPGQGDETQPARGNHDGGVIAFGPDGKLYAIVGDPGRREQMQNIPSRPAESASSAAADSARSSTAISSSVPGRRSCASGISCSSISPATATTSPSTTRASRTASPTTSRSTRSPRARAFSSAKALAS